MRRSDRLASLALTVLMVVAALAGGCAPSTVQVEARPDIDRYQIRTLVVLPFTALATPQVIDAPVPEPPVPKGVKRSDITVAVESGLERQSRATATVPASVPDRVAHLFASKLQARQDLLVIPPDEARETLQALGVTVTEESLPEVARQVAARLRADAVLAGQVLVYQEREGSKFGGSPAAVGFEVVLLAADGTRLWDGNYYERQRPMTEDLLGFVRRKGMFVTAEELARDGVAQVLTRFPYGKPPGS
ncbi:MAG: hypothetical protein ACREI3_11585 [Nitrospirales bacterium]